MALPHAALALLLPAVLPQTSPEDLTERFVAPEGSRVTLWAESPLVYNPTAIDIDGSGRVWVTEAVNYRRWGGRNQGFAHEGGDRVVVLQDTDGDGAADSSTVFAQDEDLVAPLGIALVGEWVYVSCSPYLFRYRDTDGDLVADERETVLEGWGGLDHDHGLHSVVPGDDGYLYVAAGNAGPHMVTGPDGFTLRSGSIYTGGTPYNGTNTPGLLSDDGEAWTGGINLRMRPDGSGLEVLAHNFRNQYEVTRDAFGNTYSADNDDDGNRGCRTVWAPEGADLGYFGFGGRTTWRADAMPWQDTWTAHWHQEDPGVFPAGAGNGAGGPTGCAVLEGAPAALASWDGAVLNCDAGAGVVYGHRPRVQGAGVTLEGAVFLGRTQVSGRAEDDGQGVWFRPSDVCVAADGSVLVADWYDPGVGGHGMGDRETYGRLLRVSDPAQPGSFAWSGWGPKDAWDSPCVSVREGARRMESALGSAWLGAVRTGEPRRAARALAYLTGREAGPKAARLGLAHADERVRAAAVRAIHAGEGADALLTVADTLTADPSPFVRATALRLLRTVEPRAKRDLAVELAAAGPAEDRVYLESIGLAFRGDEAGLFSALMSRDALQAGLGDGQRTLRRVAWRLHLEELLPLLQAWAQDANLPIAERIEAVDGIAWVESRGAADAMFALAHTGPAETRARAAGWLTQRAGNLWRGFGLQASSLDGMPAEAERVAAIQRPKGVVPFEVELPDAEQVWLVTTDGGDGEGCDWADWLEVAFVDADGERTPLASVGWSFESTGWGQSRWGKSAGGGPLSVAGQTFESGLGAHAPSRHAFAVPSGTVRLVGLVAPDDGGTNQGCGSTIDFEVFVVRREQADAFSELRLTALDPSAATEARATAVHGLAQSPAHALWVVENGEALGAELRAVALAALDGNPDLGVRALARPGLLPEGAEPQPFRADEILALEGDPRAGRTVFRSTAAQCSACHASGGFGNDVGPNLSAISAKYDRPGLLNAILNPSAAIAFGYETQLVATTDGEILSGFLLAQDEHGVVLKDSAGERWAIPAEEIEATRKSPLSVMPEGVALGLTPQELADLVAYLAAGPDLGRTLGEPVELFNGRDFTGLDRFVPGGEDAAGGTWAVTPDGILTCTGSPAGYFQTESSWEDFELEVEWRFDPAKGAGNSGVLLRKNGPDKVWPRSIEAQLWSTNAGDIWNIGEMAMTTDAARVKGRRTIKRHASSEHPLGAWNTYRIVMDGPLMELWVNGVLQNDATGCEQLAGPICFQSEGAWIEFRRITIRPILR
jgi:putative membrane-bound dehydrogenase-like protein